MNKGIIIAGFATCGKTYLGNKYSNVIDLESSNYKFDNTEMINIPTEKRKGTHRKINPNWPNNYYKAMIDAQRKYEIVLVQLKPEHFDYFEKIVLYEDVANKKPNPEVYIKLIKELNLKPEDCLIIEDSLSGIQAAKNANIEVLNIPDEGSLKNQNEIDNLADYKVNSLKELLDFLEAV